MPKDTPALIWRFLLDEEKEPGTDVDWALLAVKLPVERKPAIDSDIIISSKRNEKVRITLLTLDGKTVIIIMECVSAQLYYLLSQVVGCRAMEICVNNDDLIIF